MWGLGQGVSVASQGLLVVAFLGISPTEVVHSSMVKRL